ncbi:hypothetical protein ACWG8W_06410 [Citricoccus zhacaiensis]
MKEQARPRDRFDVHDVRMELIVRDGVRRAFAEKLERYHEAVSAKDSAEVFRLLGDLRVMTRYHRDPDSQLNGAAFTPRQQARFRLSIPKLNDLDIPTDEVRALIYPPTDPEMLTSDELQDLDDPWDEGGRMERATYALLHPRIGKMTRRIQREMRALYREFGPFYPGRMLGGVAEAVGSYQQLRDSRS